MTKIGVTTKASINYRCPTLEKPESYTLEITTRSQLGMDSAVSFAMKQALLEESDLCHPNSAHTTIPTPCDNSLIHQMSKVGQRA